MEDETIYDFLSHCLLLQYIFLYVTLCVKMWVIHMSKIIFLRLMAQVFLPFSIDSLISSPPKDQQ